MRHHSVDLNLLIPREHDQSRSVEAMIMSVPYTVKIKVLGRIAPPLKDAGPISPAALVRGGIVAIEGDDEAAMQELAEWLHDFFSNDKDYSPRMIEPPKVPESKDDVSFEEYLDLVRDWHGKSKEMVEYITTPINLQVPRSSSTSDKDKDVTKEALSTSRSPTPVIILPTYQLHASDAYASRIPIQDVYSPMDHWQWMATLWRGTVGPDLTIYVKQAKEGREGGRPVEIDEEGRCMTVVREEDGNENGNGKFTESSLRRVGFEVGEWIRALGARKAL